jgi:hypothetical protein
MQHQPNGAKTLVSDRSQHVETDEEGIQTPLTGDATPERLARSPDSTITKDGARQFNDSLLVRMANKGQLYPDKTINDALAAAGVRYLDDWAGSNMDPLKAVDYGQVSGGGSGGDARIPVGHRMTLMREDYRKARAALGKKYREPLELILLKDQGLVEVGQAVTGAVAMHTCRAVAIERFTAGLYLLAKHYGFIK